MSGVILNRVTESNIKFSNIKFVITPKIQKLQKKISDRCKLCLLAICAIFPGKLTRNKKDKGKRRPAIVFRFPSTLSLIMRINLTIKNLLGKFIRKA